MTDSSGGKILEGILNVSSYIDDKISGTYTFSKIYDNDFQGLSSMEGEFAGNISAPEKKVFINTNPKIADSNVFWNMTIRKNSVSGEWNFSVFRKEGSALKGKIKITG